MLLLASTSDLLRLVTSSTSAIDVQVSAMDMNVTTSERPTGYRRNTAITTATTTSIALSPGSADVLRNIKTVSARNKGGATNVVTVLHTDGTTVAECFEATLAPDWSIQYEDGVGWWVTDNQGREVVQNMTSAGVPITDSDTIVRLTSDVTNNNATANTIADVTGLSFPVLANKLYAFSFDIVYTAAATTTGSRWSISGPASPTYLNYTSEYSLTTTTTTRNALVQAYDSPAASNATSAATGNNWASIYGVIQPAADGTVIARFASEIASSAIVAKVNSFVRYRQISP
jgi:hypothetical protein